VSEVSVMTAFSLLRRAVMFELRLYRSLFRWVTRRPDVAGDVEAFGYAQLVTPVMWLWIFASAVEVPLVHVLIPWDTVRIIALALSVWGLLWMVGLLASLNVYPHLFSPTALRVRHGSSVDIALPWHAIATITAERRELPSSARTLQPRETERGTDLAVAVSGQVNVHAVLRRPTSVPTPKGDMVIAELSFLVDEPRDFVRRARQHLTGEVSGEVTGRDRRPQGQG